MEFREHRHPIVLDENFHGSETDFCCLCEQLLRSPVVHSVYHCIQRDDTRREDEVSYCDDMLVHKSCAELPVEFTNYFMHPQHPLNLVSISRFDHSEPCSICSRELTYLRCYYCKPCQMKVCIKCVTSPLVYHPSHNQHALALVLRPATFLCDACGKEARDESSCKCTTCPFWIHTSCAILSSSFQSQFHAHPLHLAYSFPEQYLKFRHYCKVCKKLIMPTLWLYYCPGCRIFVHLKCAKTPDTTLRPLGDEFGDLVHLPSQDESSLNLLRQLLIHQMMINQGEGDALTWSFSPISTITAAAAAVAVAGPNKEVIHHWSHDQHPLILRNKCSTPNAQLTTLKEHNEESDTIIVCDGCTKPINSSNTSYYECNPCKYFLHRYCAELPQQMQPYTLPYKFKPYNKAPDDNNILYTKLSSRYLFRCYGCKCLKSGIHLASDDGKYKLDIGCAMLPSKIKHEAHEHPLIQSISSSVSYWDRKSCDACGVSCFKGELCFYCDECGFNLHTNCALKPHKLKHRWDSHALTLITPDKIIEDHPHDYNCEYCSDDIDTNYWFYHCSLCDLSCHMSCIYKFFIDSNFKIGASNIIIYQKGHEHGLTLVLNKRNRCCGNCGRQLFYRPKFECPTCNFIRCLFCVDDQFRS